MDPNLVEAFRKLEAKLQEEKDAVIRKEREELLRLNQEALERERKKQEFIVYAGSIAFLVFIVILIYNSNESQIRESGGIGSWMASKANAISAAALSGNNVPYVDCAPPENWKLPVCIQAKKDEMNEKWKNMGLNKGGKEKPFAINTPAPE